MKKLSLSHTNSTISATSLRKSILIGLLNADRRDLDPQDLLSRVRSAGECRTVWIAKEEDQEDDG